MEGLGFSISVKQFYDFVIIKYSMLFDPLSNQKSGWSVSTSGTGLRANLSWKLLPQTCSTKLSPDILPAARIPLACHILKLK
jgi:hypothetical protein